MKSNLRDGEENQIFAFGHDPEEHIKYQYQEEGVENHSDGGYVPCYSCYAHFPTEEMGVMSSPERKYLRFTERVQLCEICRDKEIERIVHEFDIKNIDNLSDAYNFIVTNGTLQEISQMEKLMFLVESKKS